MRDATPAAIHLKDYRRPDYLVDTVELRVELGEESTTVHSHLAVRRRTGVPRTTPLVLDGQELELLSVAVDGQVLEPGVYRQEAESLVLDNLPARFSLEIETRIHPEKNTQLEGLYKSGGMFCTQCEAEGFRRITFFPDRPDVMARYTTTLVAEHERYPVLLANGDRVDAGRLDDGRHWARWVDPHPKPSYLFAMVAGDLAVDRARHVTPSGREVALELYVEPHNTGKTAHALASLQQAMAWDETTFGLEYDLDTYMIVAVDDFNMGAMENKGLNIFNTACVLARPDTATDADYDRIQSIVGHEYFHNWTGNRVTCRDWFQLSLKEGLTVFRDQEFSADLNSRAVRRIDEVRILREHQFPEDDGPTAHPVRPDSYIEISNFYTSTIYRKGAEVIRMLHTLLGPDRFRAGMDLYFERHDGQAVTTDDFVSAMEDASGIDLGQFRRWYSQAGTPEVGIDIEHNRDHGLLTLHVTQHTPDTPGQRDKLPLHIPLAIGLIDADGRDLPVQFADEPSAPPPGTRVIEVRQRRQSLRFRVGATPPVLSLFRDFSAPVRVSHPVDRDALIFQLMHDSDAFNRWEAGQQLAMQEIRALIAADRAGSRHTIDDTVIDGFGKVLLQRNLDRALIAEVFTLPRENYIADNLAVVDPQAIHRASRALHVELAQRLANRFEQHYLTTGSDREYTFSAGEVARRRLRNLCLAYLMELPEDHYADLCLRHYHDANNMTDTLSALVALSHRDCAQREEALEHFYESWSRDTLVVNKWLAVQAASRLPGTLARVRELTGHRSFELKNPNKVYALIGTFCRANPAQFHAPDGDGYRFLADHVIALDRINPQIAARMLTPLIRWQRLDAARQALMRGELERILADHEPSRDVYEIVSKSLA